MRYFVTGSTGLLGSNLVFELLNAGHSVKALVRSASKATAVFGSPLPAGLELVVGDLEDVAAFAPALAGCEAVFHTAAYFREYFQPGNHWDTLKRLNVTATRQLLDAAEAQGVACFVHTSSSGTIDPQIQDESSPPNPYARKNLYFKSKVESEAEVHDFLAQQPAPALRVVMILPGWMMGPYDSAPTASGQVILDLVNGQMPGYFDGGTSTVDARDVAQAMIAAARQGRSGERYIVGGEYLSLQELSRTVGEVAGIKTATRKIPNAVIMGVATLSEFWAKVSGKPTVMTREGIGTLLEKHHLNSYKAQQELGASFRPIEHTLRDELRWYAERGKVKTPIKL